jgi:Domain of unknown function (DUF4440)
MLDPRLQRGDYLPGNCTISFHRAMLTIVMTTATDTVIIEWFSRYADAFQTLEPRATLQYLHVPCTFIDTSGVRVMCSADEVEAFLAKVMLGLSRRGFVRSELTGAIVRLMNQTTALLTVRRVRYEATGQQLETVGETYTLHRSDDGWKIVVAIVHDSTATL